MSEATARSGPNAASAGALALAVLCAQQFIMAYDTVSMNVAISTIVVDLDTTLTGVQTVIVMYALVMAAFMVTGAKLADLWGRRRIFTLGALTYGTGAGITAPSPGLGVMAFGWSLIEGLGAALVTPAILRSPPLTSPVRRAPSPERRCAGSSTRHGRGTPRREGPRRLTRN